MEHDHANSTSDDHPLDDCERYIEEDYFEKVLPAFPPFEHVDRNATVTFEDSFGVRCVIGAGEIVASFLALVDQGLLPPVAGTWRALVPEDLRPERMRDRPAPASLPLPPKQDQADPSQYPAQITALVVHDNALGCPCCGTRAHVFLRTPVSEHRITERDVVAAMHQLALANAMPPLSAYWQYQMDCVYEPESETDLQGPPTGKGES